MRWWQYDPSKWVIATLSGLGLASDLKRVPDMWIQRAELAMQFKRIERALERKRAHDEWVGDRKRRLLQKWEEASFRAQLREIEHRLRRQRRRLRIMTKSLRVTRTTTRGASATRALA